eukprot:837355-Pyramimonas_sp.AAC.1
MNKTSRVEPVTQTSKRSASQSQSFVVILMLSPSRCNSQSFLVVLPGLTSASEFSTSAAALTALALRSGRQASGQSFEQQTAKERQARAQGRTQCTRDSMRVYIHVS